MNIMIKRAMPLALALVFTFVIPAAAVESPQTVAGADRKLPNEIAFQIPMNDYCSPENSFDFTFQLSNASDKPADVTLKLYHKDGSSFNEEGTSFNGIESTLVPGSPVALKGNATQLYHMNFGNHKRCDERIYMGKIIVNSGQASLLAKGWINRRVGTASSSTETIRIHDDNAFLLAKSAAESAEASPAKREEPAASSMN